MEQQDVQAAYNEAEEMRQMAQMPFLTPHQQYGSSILVMTNPDKEVKAIENALKSQAVDENGNVHKYGEPLLNEAGINSVVSQIRAIINRNTIMTDLDENEIRSLYGFLAETLAKDLMINRVKYGIKTREARSTVYYIALSMSYICLKRGHDGGERRFWRNTQQDINTTITNASKSKLPNLSGLFK